METKLMPVNILVTGNRQTTTIKLCASESSCGSSFDHVSGLCEKFGITNYAAYTLSTIATRLYTLNGDSQSCGNINLDVSDDSAEAYIRIGIPDQITAFDVFSWYDKLLKGINAAIHDNFILSHVVSFATIVDIDVHIDTLGESRPCVSYAAKANAGNPLLDTTWPRQLPSSVVQKLPSFSISKPDL